MKISSTLVFLKVLCEFCLLVHCSKTIINAHFKRCLVEFSFPVIYLTDTFKMIFLFQVFSILMIYPERNGVIFQM